MPNVTCSRCRRDAAALERAPIPGPRGDAIHRQVCRECWREWTAMQVKLINEYRLNPLDARHFDFLMEQAKTFLCYAEE